MSFMSWKNSYTGNKDKKQVLSSFTSSIRSNIATSKMFKYAKNGTIRKKLYSMEKKKLVSFKF